MNEAGPTPLQFDRVVPDSPTASRDDRVAAVCVACGAAIETEYYQINGHVACASCRSHAEASAETPRGIRPLVTAGFFGLGAGLVGAVIYFAVIALLDLEIGLVAILIGYMVGYAIRKGTRGRGGRRFQVLAIALTYGSISVAYTSIALKSAIEKTETSASAAASAGQTTVQPDRTERRETSLFAAVARGMFLLAVVPLLVVLGSLPGSLISGLIILIGMGQAWRMTGTPHLEILGPYRLGTAASSEAV
jgi:ABC-type multidrug transport system fused ATPase/permease subunit